VSPAFHIIITTPSEMGTRGRKFCPFLYVADKETEIKTDGLPKDTRQARGRMESRMSGPECIAVKGSLGRLPAGSEPELKGERMEHY
jgi:hypothetical protein